MKEVIAICNQKGGVGKSTTANALGAGLHYKGFKVLYIDLDAQGNLSYSMGATNKPISSLEVLTATATARDATMKTIQGYIIPASSALASADITLKDTGREYKLKEAIEPILDDYDYLILDTPPAIGTLTINALTACNSVIVPAQADIYSLQGIGQLAQTIMTVKKYTNKDIYIKGLLVTRFNARAVLTRDMTDLLENTAVQLHSKLYDTKIRECISLKECQARQQDIFAYAPKSNAAADYSALIEEILG